MFEESPLAGKVLRRDLDSEKFLADLFRITTFRCLSFSLIIDGIRDCRISVALVGSMLAFLDESSDDSESFIMVFLEVETIIFSMLDHEKIVIKRLFGDSDLFGCFLKRIFVELACVGIDDSIVELSPFKNEFNGLTNFPFLMASSSTRLSAHTIFGFRLLRKFVKLKFATKVRFFFNFDFLNYSDSEGDRLDRKSVV